MSIVTQNEKKVIMKNLKKLSRSELKKVSGGNFKPSFEVGDCGSSCSIGDNTCEQYGLSCGVYMLTNGEGVITSSCMKCM